MSVRTRAKKDRTRSRKIHLVGMGGIGMSGIARLLIARGESVSGSDLQDNALLKKIRSLGAKVWVGHSPVHLNHPDLVVYSSSIPPSNPELIAARNRNLRVIHRGQMVASLLEGYRTIAVTGAHGKSTTTAMAAELLVRARMDPTVLMGAEVESLGGNFRFGRGPYALVEADESDGSFLWLRPRVALLTNLDEEHLDYFRNRQEIEKAFAAFADRLLPGGTLIGCVDDPGVAQLLRRVRRRPITYGLSRRAQFRAIQIRCSDGASEYGCLKAGKLLGTVQLKIPGIHNVVNSLGVVALAESLGIDFKTTQAALGGYRGAKRRFEILGELHGVLVVEDYAHHPVEIQATLQAARSWKERRLRLVFQPHRYTRTRYLLDRFVSSFSLADEVILLPIYAASEEPMKGVTAEALSRAISSARKGRVRVRSSEEALTYLHSTAKPGDLMLFLGAGSIGGMAGRLMERLRSPHRAGGNRR